MTLFKFYSLLESAVSYCLEEYKILEKTDDDLKTGLSNHSTILLFMNIVNVDCSLQPTNLDNYSEACVLFIK